MQLSQHLSLAEMVNSDFAKKKNILNNPSNIIISNMKLLAENVFEPIRQHFNAPIYISSGYRSFALNKALGGSSSSQHVKGEAMDIDMDNTSITNAQIFDYIKSNVKFDQLIWEFGTKDNPEWVHVSYAANGRQRRQILKAKRKGKSKIYEVYS